MIKCDYCGKVNKETVFFIGAKRSDHDGFCMVEGTGKMACNECYPKASAEGSKAIDEKADILFRYFSFKLKNYRLDK